MMIFNEGMSTAIRQVDRRGCSQLDNNDEDERLSTQTVLFAKFVVFFLFICPRCTTDSKHRRFSLALAHLVNG